MLNNPYYISSIYIYDAPKSLQIKLFKIIESLISTKCKNSIGLIFCMLILHIKVFSKIQMNPYSLFSFGGNLTPKMRNFKYRVSIIAFNLKSQTR